MSLSTLVDRTIIYGGGGGVVVSSQALQAQSQPIPLMSVPVPIIEITIGDVCTIIATIAVVSKGVMDYLTYRRRNK